MSQQGGPSAASQAQALLALGVGSPLSVQASNTYENLVADGLISGTSTVLKFGGGFMDTTERQPRGNLVAAASYTYPSAGFTVEALSTDAQDNASTGTGARTLYVEGIRADTYARDSETISLTGVTPATAASPITWLRIDRCKVLTCGTYGQLDNAAAGVITVRTAGAGQTHATLNGQGQSLIADYTIPAGKTGHIHGVILSSESTKPAIFHLHIRENIDTLAAPFAPCQIKQPFYGVEGVVSVVYEHPLVVPAKSDIMWGAYLASGTGLVGIVTIIELRDAT